MINLPSNVPPGYDDDGNPIGIRRSRGPSYSEQKIKEAANKLIRDIAENCRPVTDEEIRIEEERIAIAKKHEDKRDWT